MKKVLFVCSGNTCRSPMAAGWFNRLAKEKGAECTADSAGTSAKAAQGNPASENAVAVMKESGVDLSEHLSRRITPEMAAGYDLIAVMGKKGKQELLKAVPEAEGKIFLLMHFSKLKPDKDVPNPFKGDMAKYQQCFDVMKEAIENLFDQITMEERNDG